MIQDGGFHTLEITSTNYKDAGLYSLCATNVHGATTCHANLIIGDGLHVYTTPKFLTDLKDVIVPENSTLLIEGVVEAYPVAGITWCVSIYISI
jgi:hypothetical protein